MLDKYGNSNDDDEDKDGSGNCINNGGKGDIYFNKIIIEIEWMIVLFVLVYKNLKKSF